MSQIRQKKSKSASPTDAATDGPIRSCIGCRQTRSQSRLVRLAIGPTGLVTVGRNLPGRGAWLCADEIGADEIGADEPASQRPLRPECLALALRRGGINRAFRTRFAPADVARVLHPDLVLVLDQFEARLPH